MYSRFLASVERRVGSPFPSSVLRKEDKEGPVSSIKVVFFLFTKGVPAVTLFAFLPTGISTADLAVVPDQRALLKGFRRETHEIYAPGSHF